MSKPVCVKCQLFFRPYRNGEWVLEQKPVANGAKPGREEPDKWVPYKLWHVDRWKCRGCDTEIIVGFAPHPSWQDFHSPTPPKTPEMQHIVNDC
jgi:hypothetical protein